MLWLCHFSVKPHNLLQQEKATTKLVQLEPENNDKKYNKQKLALKDYKPFQSASVSHISIAKLKKMKAYMTHHPFFSL